jgi:hypothetical protein
VLARSHVPCGSPDERHQRNTFGDRVQSCVPHGHHTPIAAHTQPVLVHCYYHTCLSILCSSVSVSVLLCTRCRIKILIFFESLEPDTDLTRPCEQTRPTAQSDEQAREEFLREQTCESVHELPPYLYLSTVVIVSRANEPVREAGRVWETRARH